MCCNGGSGAAGKGETSKSAGVGKEGESVSGKGVVVKVEVGKKCWKW
jgi:hypothetical protein